MDFLLFTLSCFIGFDIQFACEQKAMPRGNDTYLECVMRGRDRVNNLNDFLVPNQYGDQIVTICLPWQKDKTYTTEYIPKSYTADEIISHTNMDLITFN